MDRFTGLSNMDHAEAAQLLLERDEWERDQQAIREYESWFLHKTIMEADAENLDVR